MSFAALELSVGLYSHSLSLLADSGHMLFDGLAIALALLAAFLGQRLTGTQPQSAPLQVEVLAALVNGVGLLLMAGWIAWEALLHLHSPPVEILSLPMLFTAVVGLGVNLANVLLLHRHSPHDLPHDLNVRGVFLHIVADAVSSIGAILAAIAIAWQHWIWADGVISLLIAGVMVWFTFPLVLQALEHLCTPTDSAPTCDRCSPENSPETLLFPTLEASVRSRR